MTYWIETCLSRSGGDTRRERRDWTTADPTAERAAGRSSVEDANGEVGVRSVPAGHAHPQGLSRVSGHGWGRKGGPGEGARSLV